MSDKPECDDPECDNCGHVGTRSFHTTTSRRTLGTEKVTLCYVCWTTHASKPTIYPSNTHTPEDVLRVLAQSTNMILDVLGGMK